MTDPATLKFTPLDALHRALGGKMVPFAGYAMPVQYPAGILREHLHTRKAAGLFDVSHMGQLRLTGPNAIAAIERLVPGDIAGLAEGRVRYTMLTNPAGGIIDDLMIARRAGGELGLVVNAGTKENDIAHIEAHLPAGVMLIHETGRALLALQGPMAATVMARHIPEAARMPFMAEATVTLAGVSITMTRSGYTGEDGFELSIPAERAEDIARLLLAEPDVLPVGARRPRFAAAGGRAVPLRPRYRRDRNAGRGRADLDDFEAAAPRAGSPATRSSGGRSPKARLAAASGFCPKAAPRRARARKFTMQAAAISAW